MVLDLLERLCGSGIPGGPVGVVGTFKLVLEWFPARLTIEEEADFWRKT
jgi:hypothetical protein